MRGVRGQKQLCRPFLVLPMENISMLYQRCSAGCHSSCQNRGRVSWVLQQRFCFLFQHERVSTALTKTISLPKYLPRTNRLNICFIFQKKRKVRVKVLSLESITLCSGQTEVEQLSPKTNISIKMLLWKHKPKNFLLCYITKYVTSPVMFRNGGSNQSFVTWLVEIGGVYEITWDHGKTQVANILEDGLQTWKWELMGPEIPWECLPWAENTNLLKLSVLGLY